MKISYSVEKKVRFIIGIFCKLVIMILFLLIVALPLVILAIILDSIAYITKNRMSLDSNKFMPYVEKLFNEFLDPIVDFVDHISISDRERVWNKLKKKEKKTDEEL